MAKIEINGKEVDAPEGSTIIEAAEKIGIWIPRFCYHKKLSIAANCRMCLVDVEKSPKPLPACATPITEGMKIETRSEKALLSQKAVMEFLLINHPLDCPICDQGGECELQDIAIGYGSDFSRYTQSKRVVKDKPIGPLVATDMTRCIQCTRCVRFGAEVAGCRELGATGRGEHMEIGTFIEKNVTSEISGNIIDLCPVGALTSKPFRFQARSWELQQAASIAPHDCMGSNIFVHSRRQEVMRVVPRENESINEVWLSDRDRFSYEGLYEERLSEPKIKKAGAWISVSWTEALEFLVQGLKESVKKLGAEFLGSLASPNLTLEEFYLLQKLLRGLGTNNIDHRLRERDFRDQHQLNLMPGLGFQLTELEQQSVIVLVGSDLRNEQPIFNVKLRKFVLNGNGKKVCAVNPADFDYNFDLTEKVIVQGGELWQSLAAILKALLQKNSQEIQSKSNTIIPKSLQNLMASMRVDQEALNIASHLLEAEKSSIILGAYSLSHPEASKIRSIAMLFNQLLGINVGILTEGANSAGAWMAGCVPHRGPNGSRLDKPGLTIEEFWEKPLQAMLLVNIDPDLDCANSNKVIETLSKMNFVAAISPYESQSLKEVADVLLPMTPFTENSGTFINAMGQWQSFPEVVPPHQDSRPLWKILRVLGNLFELEGFQYNSAVEVRSELSELLIKNSNQHSNQQMNPLFEGLADLFLQNEKSQYKNKILRIASLPLYASDNIVRRAASLQKTEQAKIKARMNNRLAKEYHLTDGQYAKFKTPYSFNQEEVNKHSVILPIEIDDSIPDKIVIIPTASQETKWLGPSYLPLEMEAIKDYA